MRRAVILLLAAGLALDGCGRDFEAPGPQVELQSFVPAGGFSGIPVALCARNLPPQTARIVVTFDLVPAEATLEPPADWDPATAVDCAEPLYVRVPVLPPAAEREGARIALDTGSSQDVAEARFDYRGPGHPVLGRIQKELHLRAGLAAVFTPPGLPVPAYGAVSQQARSVSLFEPSAGLHLDFGQCELPLSAAAAITRVELGQEADAEFSLYAVGMRLDSGDGTQEVELSMWRWPISLRQVVVARQLAPPLPVELPTTQDGQPFRPHQVWAFPRPGESVLQDVVVSHVSRPALAILPVDGQGPARVIEVVGQTPSCPGADGLGPFADVVYDPDTRDFYAGLATGAEIWRLPLAVGQPRRMWPPPAGVADDLPVNCNWKTAALALRQTHAQHQHLRLYAASASLPPQVAELRLEDVGPGEYLRPVRLTTLDARVYALKTARYPVDTLGVTGERLVAATTSGLVLIDVTAALPAFPDFARVGEVPIPMNDGGSQSLVAQASFSALTRRADTLVVADAHRDLVLFYEAGREELLLADVSLGATVPGLTSSFQGDRLFYTDVLSNSVQVIDRDSGMRRRSFPIAALSDHAYMGFGSTGMASLRGLDYDLLMLPLLDLSLDEDGDGLSEQASLARYEQLAFGRFGAEPPACGLADSGMAIETADIGEFHKLQVVRWDWADRLAVPVAVFTRERELVPLLDADLQPTGQQRLYEPRTWCLELDPDAPPDGVLAEGAGPLCDLAPAPAAGESVEVRLVRAAERAPALARLEERRQEGGEPRTWLRLFVLDPGGAPPGEGLQAELHPDLAPFVSDMQLLTGGTPARPVFVVYLPLSQLGRVHVVTFDPADGSATHADIETGGAPYLLTVSPDGRQAYATHPLDNRVDVLRLACDPDGTCQTLASTLDVGAMPYQVQFDDTGRYAFVVHLFSNDVTVIE